MSPLRLPVLPSPFVEVRHTTSPRKGLKRRPFLGLLPGFAVPPAFLPHPNLKRAHAPLVPRLLWSRVWLGCTRLFSSAGPARTFTPPPSKDTDQLLLLPIFQPTCPEKTKFPVHSFSGSAFGYSSFRTFVSPRSLQLRSAPPVNPACAALRGALNAKPRRARFRALRLRSAPEIDSTSLRLFPRQL